MTAKSILIVSTDAEFRDSLSAMVKAAGLVVKLNASIQDWLSATDFPEVDCVVVDAELGDLRGQDQLVSFAVWCEKHPVLVVAKRGDVPMAVLAMKQGAEEILQRTSPLEHVLGRIRRILLDGAQHGQHGAARSTTYVV